MSVRDDAFARAFGDDRALGIQHGHGRGGRRFSGCVS